MGTTTLLTSEIFQINQKRHLQLKDSFSWPPQPKDLEPGKLTLPNKLNLIMNSLLNDKDEQLLHKDRFRGQDIYAAPKRRLRTPKTIILVFMVKTLTNN